MIIEVIDQRIFQIKWNFFDEHLNFYSLDPAQSYLHNKYFYGVAWNLILYVVILVYIPFLDKYNTQIMSNLTNKTESYGPTWSRYALKYRGYTSTQSAVKMPEFSYDGGMLLKMTNQIKEYRYTTGFSGVSDYK